MKLQYCLEYVDSRTVAFQVVFMDIRFFEATSRVVIDGVTYTVCSNNNVAIGPNRTIYLWGLSPHRSLTTPYTHSCNYPNKFISEIHQVLGEWARVVDWDVLDEQNLDVTEIRPTFYTEKRLPPIGKVWTV